MELWPTELLSRDHVPFSPCILYKDVRRVFSVLATEEETHALSPQPVLGPVSPPGVFSTDRVMDTLEWPLKPSAAVWTNLSLSVTWRGKVGDHVA